MDGGATSCTGVLESGINLQISLRLEPLLQLLGYDTVSVRKTDTSVYTEGETIAQQKLSDLKARANLVNSTDGAILLSIHQNTFSDSRYGGAQVFYAPTPGSRELAERIQTALAATVNKGSGRKCKKADSVYLLQHINAPGVLVECGFLSNPEEEARLRESDYQKRLCCVLAATLAAHLGGT